MGLKKASLDGSGGEAERQVPSVPAATSEVAMKTPSEWCSIMFPPHRGHLHPELYKHSGAESLHGWKAHAHHQGAEMRLSRADYEAALEASTRPPCTPHPAACSPHAPRAAGKAKA